MISALCAGTTIQLELSLLLPLAASSLASPFSTLSSSFSSTTSSSRHYPASPSLGLFKFENKQHYNMKVMTTWMQCCFSSTT
jgi:hypothetical protein